MKHLLRISILALAVCAAIPSQSSAQPIAPRTVSAVTAHASAPVQTMPAAPLAVSLVTLLGFAIGSTRDLSKTYLFHGITYGPGEDVEVPDDFPDIDERGDVIHEAGSEAARNQARARSFSSPPSTGGVNTGEGGARSVADNSKDTVSGKSRVQLEGMKKEDLEDLAAKKDIVVERGDGQEGEPLKTDYVEALSAAAAE